jgi:hypothetical protein
MDDCNSPPLSPKSPFSKYLADASPTHFNFKFINKELAKPNGMLEMALKEVEHKKKKRNQLTQQSGFPW